MEGWWCVQYGDALACVQAPSAAEALRRSLDLHPLADWTDDARKLVVFPQDDYPAHARRHDYTRAVLNAEPPLLERRRARLRGLGSSLAISCLAAVVALGLVAGVSAETWRGLTVAPEHHCAPYDKKRDYPYPQSVERDIVRELGAVYGPYTGTCFASTTETDIEHIVAASEAHDSGLVRTGRSDPGSVRRRPSQSLPRLTSGESPGEERQGRRRLGPGPEPMLVRSTGARGPPGLRAHHRSARSGGARSNPRCLRDHGARAHRVRGAFCLSKRARSQSYHRW